MDGLMAALWIRRIYFAGKKKKHFLELAKKNKIKQLLL
jgi:hypothetical protein